ncbi:MAG: ISTde1 transposase [Stygiobacter sp.]|nr:MAG: ISTde1 transposase [Stygiobacter sp.]
MHLTMNTKERERLQVLHRIEQKEITITNAAASLSMSERQMYRILSRYRREGDRGITHKSRGKQSPHRTAPQIRKQVSDLFRQKYRDYGATLFSEKLEEHHNIFLSNKTVTRILKSEQLYVPSRHRKTHRKKREPRACIGELIQFDGSDHHWFEDRSEKCCLLVAIDDASNEVMMRFAPSESTDSVLEFWKLYCAEYGIPRAIYSDHGSVYYDSPDSITQYQRAMNDLNVHCIFANSPQAKGRVERSNRTHQDRLLKALREENISTIEQANLFLETKYLKQHNHRFAHTTGKQDIHRSSDGISLDAIFCFQTTRTVNNDYTIMLNSQYIQLCKGDNPLPPPRSKVILKKYLDESLHILWKNNELHFLVLEHKPIREMKKPNIPKSNHPWKNRWIDKSHKKHIDKKIDLNNLNSLSSQHSP